MVQTPAMETPIAPRSPRKHLSQMGGPCKRLYMPLLAIVVLGIMLGYVYLSLVSMTHPNPMILPPKTIASLNRVDATHSSFGKKRLDIQDYPEDVSPATAVRTRVVMFLLDGMHFDAVLNHPEMNGLLNEPSFKKDSAVFKLTIPMPSISLPSWITHMTGSSPQYHGVSGNSAPEEVISDNLFRQAQNYGLRAAMTGDQDWRTLFTTSLQPLFGDGTRAPALNAALDETHQRGHSFIARDESWANIMYEAMLTPSVYSERDPSADWLDREPQPIDPSSVDVTYFPYDFFLSYFEDIDGQGHSFGSSSSNYASAITKKTNILRNFFEKLGQIDDIEGRSPEGQKWRTIVAITADHGHVDVGGHGGTASQVTQIPLVFYCNGSNLGTAELEGRMNIEDPLSLTRSTPYTSHDVSTTLAALLGVPTPRQSEGKMNRNFPRKI
ncbi:type I phosphodiesterase/nucleotide pyrophosphatase domain protein [Planoprotostelium fungivorum]|uniref:Type I phosphodiesterase/nucleotide pyrophosphatase domain protein n=1 Tax=Planoprotostelium fungivorum TaxID=1890364 RepID=A0A2P6MWH9_9EUKA|nr:type I phosphodiesterase/nucleotide pyrophosphatase domain protein [Planoprotostelium fungivorum]